MTQEFNRKYHFEVWHAGFNDPILYTEQLETFSKLVAHLAEDFETRYPSAYKIRVYVYVEKKRTQIANLNRSIFMPPSAQHTEPF